MSDPPVPLSPPVDATDRYGSGNDPGPDSSLDLQQLGRRLREARLRQGQSIEYLSDRLHIAPHQLQALEDADRDRLPEVVFVIAQAKRVAEVLGVDVDDVITRLRQESLPGKQARTETSPSARPSRSLPRAGSSIAAVRSISAFGFPPSLGSLLHFRGGLFLVVTLGGLAVLGLLLRPRPGVIPMPAPPVAAPSSPGPVAGPGDRGGSEVLVLRASEPSWIEVRRSGGERLFEGTLEGERRFPLGQGVEVKAGRPYAVTAAVGSQPPRPLGTVDDIVWRRFTPGGPAASQEAPGSARPVPAP